MIGCSRVQAAAWRIGKTQSVVARLQLGGDELRLATPAHVARASDSDLVVDLRPRETSGATASWRRLSYTLNRRSSRDNAAGTPVAAAPGAADEW
jgi:hypothetical protein